MTAPASNTKQADTLMADTVCDPGLSLGDTLQGLMASRTLFEKLAETQHARLSEMRDRVRAEAAAVQADLLEKLDLTQTERDAVRRQVECLKEEVRRLQVERDLALDEVAELRQRLEQQRLQDADIERTIQAIRDGGARRDQDLKEERARYQKLEQEHAELVEMLDGIERLDAEIRQQQAEVRRDREQLAHERQQVKSASPPAPPAAPPGPPMISFTCKKCGAALQAPERRAGLVIKCTQCARVVPVPKLSDAR